MPAKNNLQYEAQEPAFLRRLRAQNSGQSADGRHERPVARARKPKVDDEEDAPAYVDENSNETLSKAEYEALMKSDNKPIEGQSGGDDDVKAPTEDETPGVTGELTGTDPKAAGALPGGEKKESSTKEAIVGNKKRKSAKIIGNDDEDQNDEQSRKSTTASKKQKKKGKPIKLSFDEEEES